MQNNFIFVDTEADSNIVDDELEILSFKMGCAIFWNKEKDLVVKKTYYDIGIFWDDIELSFNSKYKHLIMFAHNTQFDFKMLNGFHELLLRDWELQNHYVRNKTFILLFKKIDKISGDIFVLHVWDTMNYETGPVSYTHLTLPTTPYV